MARADDTEIIDRFEEFYRSYYRNEIADLAQKYPSEQKSLYIDWRDLSRFDTDLADDFRNKPTQLRQYAEEALRLYDLPVDVSLGQAHVRVSGLPESTDIREIRSDHRDMLITVQGIIRKATDVRPKVTTAAFECQRCGTLTRIPQDSSDFQEPHECQGCERQGPFQINYDQSEFIDAQRLRVQESPEGLRGGETPQSIDVNIEDDITGDVTPGDHVSVTGVLKLEQQGNQREKSPLFDVYMDGLSVEVEDAEFEEMDITDADKKQIIELSNEPDIYEQVTGAIAPSIYGYEKEKLAMALQLFSGVTKHLPDGSRTRGDLHMLLIGDPGTGKCQRYDTDVLLADGSVRKLGNLVEEHLDNPVEIDDGYRQSTDIGVLTTDGGTVQEGRATRVWKREAPDRMYRIRTASGRELEVTPSHPLFVQDGGTLSPVVASELSEGRELAAVGGNGGSTAGDNGGRPETGGGALVQTGQTKHRSLLGSDIGWDPIESITAVEPDYDWVYDLEVAETHNYISEGVVSHNSALLQYVDNIAPRSVYTSGKGATSAGLCVTGDTLVHTTDGFREIQTLVTPEIPEEVDSETSAEHERLLYTYDREESTLDVRASSHVWRMPEKPCHRIETGHGKELEASADTPVLTCSGGSIEWKRIADVRQGEHVAVPAYDSAAQEMERARIDLREYLDLGTENVKLTESSLDAELMYLLGLVFGDGDVAVDRRDDNRGVVRFSSSNEALLERAAGIVADKFDKHVEIEHHEERVPCIRIHSGTITRLFANAGMESPKEQRSLDPKLTTAAHADAFLRGLMDADGAVSVRENGDSSIVFSTISESLARQVQLMLDTYGVRARTSERDRRGTSELASGHGIESKHVKHCLEIYGADIDQYADVIGFGVEEKQEQLQQIAGGTERRESRLPVANALATVETTAGEYSTQPVRGDDPNRKRAAGILDSHGLGAVESLVSEAVEADLHWEEVVASLDTGRKEVFDLTVPGTHNFVGNGIVTHNTAAAVRDDFGDGQQWTLEAGALVLADKGIAAVDELDKMSSEDQSAMHQALEEQAISVNKAGINATLKSRCSLLGAANPTMGRFDPYEPISEQIDLAPPLISRFDLIFTVTDQPDPEEDAELAEHILQTNYAGELHTHRTESNSSNYTPEEVDRVTDEVAPTIEPDLLRKYIAYARRTCFPTMTEEAKAEIQEFYVDLRAEGASEDAPVPVTARKLEALVRLAEASARVRLSDTVELSDADRAIDIAHYCLKEIGLDPETGNLDADVIETGTSKSQRDRVKNLLDIVADIESEYDEGAPVDVVLERAEEVGVEPDKAEHEIDKLKQKGEIYEPKPNHLRTT